MATPTSTSNSDINEKIPAKEKESTQNETSDSKGTQINETGKKDNVSEADERYLVTHLQYPRDIDSQYTQLQSENSFHSNFYLFSTSTHAKSSPPQNVFRIPEVPENEHRLENVWSFWFVRRTVGSRTMENYEKNIRLVGTFASVEGFWNYYNHLIRASDVSFPCDFHLFKNGIKPMWEDEANAQGGKWILRVKKGYSSYYWEELLIAAIGEQFDAGNDICGVVMSIRFNEDILSIWNKSATDKDSKNKIYEKMKQIFSGIPNLTIEYKAHDTSIKDSSSFRNTENVPSASHPPRFERRTDFRTPRERPDWGERREREFRPPRDKPEWATDTRRDFRGGEFKDGHFTGGFRGRGRGERTFDRSTDRDRNLDRDRNFDRDRSTDRDRNFDRDRSIDRDRSGGLSSSGERLSAEKSVHSPPRTKRTEHLTPQNP